jgi:hypothetical protein
MELLSIAEAAQLTGRHEKTIRRWIKKQLDTDPQAKDKIVQESIASGFTYRIDKDYLLSHSPTPLDSLPTQDSEHSPPQDTRQTTQQTDQVIQAKDETIALLKQQILLQQDQLKQKDDQIKTILERARETNVLLKGYQETLLLGAPKQDAVHHPLRLRSRVSKPLYNQIDRVDRTNLQVRIPAIDRNTKERDKGEQKLLTDSRKSLYESQQNNQRRKGFSLG